MKNITILFIIIFSSFKGKSQDNESFMVNNKNKPILNARETKYLILRGITDNYKWDNVNINILINYGLKKRKTANILLIPSLTFYSISIIAPIILLSDNTTSNNNQEDSNIVSNIFNGIHKFTDAIIVSSVFLSIGTAFLIPSIIFSTNASKSIKVAAIKIHNR